MRMALLNQDPGVRRGAAKGAATHLSSMEAALRSCGADVVAIDCKDAQEARHDLERAHEGRPLRLVYERYAIGATTGGAFARSAGIPHVLEVNAPLLHEAREHRAREVSAEDDALERGLFHAADRLLCVSNGVADYVRRHGVSESRVIVRPNAVDAQLFRPREDRAECRRSLGIEDAFVLGFHGRLRPWHGFERLVSVANALRRRGVPAHVLAVGEGPYREQLEGALPADAWTALGWTEHEELPRWVACFDALALTYRPDTPCYFSPLKLAEAMAAGVVPVVPALGDLQLAVEHGRSGLVVSEATEEAFTNALARVAIDPELRQTLSRGARAAACARTWNDLAAEVLSWGHEVPA